MKRITSAKDLTSLRKELISRVKKNDRILFSSYAGTEVTIDGKEYLIMPEEDILAVVK